MRNADRVRHIQELLRDNELDLLICALPANVLMLSGYWPVVGTGVVAASADGCIRLLVPSDEENLTGSSWADDIQTFQAGSLACLETPADAIRNPLKRLGTGSPTKIGFELGETSEPESYAALNLYGAEMESLLGDCYPCATLFPADDILSQLKARKTAIEIDRIRKSCRIAEKAFTKGAASISAGITEIDAANAFRLPLSQGPVEYPEVKRSDGFAWCMSGANSALASGAYAISSAKRLERGDFTLIHCNSYVDGYWTDITRTFSVGNPDERQSEIIDAIFEARQAALDAIRPGVRAAAIDHAAREVLNSRRFGDAYKHSTGHGVGFGAISAGALPRLHPKSPDILEPGMVFNVEPAAYFESYGGMRHCDIVAVTDTGYELLTPFQCRPEDLSAGE